jgi:hypothetical protein
VSKEEEPEHFRPGALIGSKVPPQKFKCGGWTGCDELHEFLAPEDVLVLTEALHLDGFRESHHWSKEAEDKAVANKALFVGRIAVIPTLLGMWWEETSVN